MNDNLIYCSYDDYAVIYDIKNHSFSISVNGKNVVTDAKISLISRADKKSYPLSVFETVTQSREIYDRKDCSYINIEYKGNAQFESSPSLQFRLTRKGVEIFINSFRPDAIVIDANMAWGENPTTDTFAMCLDRDSCNVRAAIGPATSTIDNALFDRLTDSALTVCGGKSTKLGYDWQNSTYTVTLDTGFVESPQSFYFSVKKDIIADKYGMDYKPINKNSTFSKPPAGWMTWYSVGFDAGEKTVLENVKCQCEKLKDYGADAVWVDWEWYHQDFKSERDDGTDTFSPDKKKYPNGLKKVSDEIKKAGFVPALWIGFTHDSSHNEFTKKHPEIIFHEEKSWCGKYFYDFTHPKYLNEFLPKALSQVFEWGYDAVKFDTLPILMDYHDRHHMNLYDPTLTTKQAYRQVIKKAREVLGKDMYMLSCAAIRNSDVLWAADIFDAARVGNDIFGWEEFIKEGVMRTLELYTLHNMVLYADPDNVIIREEYNTYEQALSRAYFVAMLGLPMTFGDKLPELPDDRIDILRRCLPVMDIHPSDIKGYVGGTNDVIINLAIAKPYESYNVFDAFNFSTENITRKVYIESDLSLDEGEYLIWNYTDNKFEGFASNFINVELKGCQSKVFSVRKKLDRPQIISTSRHITQGAAEIKDMNWSDSETTLHITAELVKNDEYKVYLYVPSEYKLNESLYNIKQLQENVFELSFMPEENKTYNFDIGFSIIK